MLTVRISVVGGVADVWEVPPGVQVIVRDYDDPEHMDYDEAEKLPVDDMGDPYVESVYGGREP
jgi:hypothetical protein